MDTVPLHCHICPKRPDFSDISHLLTHIGSKGHLSHYFKAQVRGNQDASIREQLDIYERWYAEHQIEKLLSQRMVLKDSKKANGIARATTREKSALTKSAKPSRAIDKKGAHRKKSELTAKTEAFLIDPQLSQPSATIPRDTTPCEPSSALSSPGFDITSIQYHPFPPLRSFYTPHNAPAGAECLQQQRLATRIESALAEDAQMAGSDTECDDRPSLRRSTEPLYPDPPMTQITSAPSESMEIPSTTRAKARGRPRLVQSYRETCETEELAIPRTPELKGVYYPGMSLFDSASAEAQKKRNQRKNDSLLAQIQQESLEIECNEYIYWPDGSLKMCRFITGDVQSSPFKEDTAPLPPPKRRRGRKSKNAREGVEEGRNKRANQLQVNQNESATGGLSSHPEVPTKPPNMHDPLSSVLGNDMASVDFKEDGGDWLLNMGERTSGSRRLFPIFQDKGMPGPGQVGTPIKQQPNPLNPSMSHNSPRSLDDAYSTWPMTSNPSDEARYCSNSIAEHLSSSFTEHRIKIPRRPILGASPSRLASGPSNESLHNLESDGDSPTDEPGVRTGPVMSLLQSTYPSFRQGKENIPPSSGGAEGTSNYASFGSHPTEIQKYFMIQGNQRAQVSTSLPPEMAFAGMGTPPVYRASLNPLNPNAHLRQSLPYSNNYTPFRSG